MGHASNRGTGSLNPGAVTAALELSYDSLMAEPHLDLFGLCPVSSGSPGVMLLRTWEELSYQNRAWEPKSNIK